MEDNEMMVSEEIVETVAKSGFKKALAIGGVVAGVSFIGFGLYKGFCAIRAKVNARKEQDAAENQED